MNKLEYYKIQDLDDIFYATKDSQGYQNALLAIRYVLFNDTSIFKGKTPLPNKYLYISRTNNARKKAMLLQTDDLAHILIKYCMQSFGLHGKEFQITEEEFALHRKNIKNLDITAYEMIECISYIAQHDLYVAYSLLYANNRILNDIVEYMIQERYGMERKENLDNFTGVIDNDAMDKEKKFIFYEAYINIDENFGEIKRNNKDYIR